MKIDGTVTLDHYSGIPFQIIYTGPTNGRHLRFSLQGPTGNKLVLSKPLVARPKNCCFGVCLWFWGDQA